MGRGVGGGGTERGMGEDEEWGEEWEEEKQ